MHIAALLLGLRSLFDTDGRKSHPRRMALLATVLLVAAGALMSCAGNGVSDSGEGSFDGDPGASAAEFRAPVLRSLAITPRKSSVGVGATEALTATGTFSNGARRDLTAQVTWASPNRRIATISNAPRTKGVVTGRSIGHAAITACFQGHTAAAVLTVTGTRLESILVTPVSPTIAAGSVQQFSATGLYSDGSTLDLTTQAIWSSSDPVGATIGNAPGQAGLAIALSPNTTTISASVGPISGSTSLTITAASLVAIQVVPSLVTIAAGTVQQFVAVGVFSDSSTQNLTEVAAWTSSDERVASTTFGGGLALGASPGAATIAATFGGITGTTVLTVTSSVLVSISILPTNASIGVGTALQYVAVGVYTDSSTIDLTASVVWSSSDEVIAVVSNDAATPGLAVGLSEGAATIFATLSGVTGATVVFVTQPPLVNIAVTPINVTTSVGTVVQFLATGFYADATTQDLTSSARWASSDPGVAVIDDSPGLKGLATAVSSGSATIVAVVDGIAGSTELSVTP